MPKIKSEKGLWDLAIENADVEKETSQTSEDAAVFVIGSKDCGKTSLILRFLERDEAPKSTVALEYTFGRRAKGHNIAKDVGHIWELGGGTWLTKLMDIPLNPDTLKHTTLVIMVDLSLPNVLWHTLEILLAAAKSRLEHVITEKKPSDPDIREKLRTQGWERLNGDHMDKAIIEPFPIPLVIIGGKYDLFQNFDSEKRKIICKTLRFVAHVHGAHLQFFSSKQDQLVSKSRALVSHYLFGTAASKTLQTDHNKPLLVPPGADAISNIGNPPLPSEDLGRVHARSPLELWKISYSHYFPAETHNNPSVKEDPAKDPQYKEPAIDSLRAQKDEELERYRRLSERRSRDLSQQPNETF